MDESRPPTAVWAKTRRTEQKQQPKREEERKSKDYKKQKGKRVSENIDLY